MALIEKLKWFVDAQKPVFTTSVRPGTKQVVFRNAPNADFDVLCQVDGLMVGGLNAGGTLERDLRPSQKTVGLKAHEPEAEGSSDGFIEFHG